jgi:hypothetical protein
MTPYDKFKDTEEWQIINKAVQELIENNDIKPLTPNDYIIGFIVKQLIDKQNVSQNLDKQIK